MDASRLAAYQALWQKYRINAVKFMFIPRYSNAEYNQATDDAAGVVSFAGQLTFAYVSLRSTVAPTSYADALAFNDVRVFTFPNGRPRSVYEKRPVVQIDNVDGVGTDTEFTTATLSLSDAADAVHYAAGWWPESEGTGTMPYTCIVTMYITFMDARS